MAKDGWAEMRGKSVDEVDIRDDFMFSYVMRNPAICTQLLEYLLPECKIARIKYIDWDTDETAEEECHMPKMRLAKPEMQKAFFGAAGKRGVRLDAYLDDGKSIYNIELQTSEHICICGEAEGAKRLEARAHGVRSAGTPGQRSAGRCGERT